jgi:hypothetical protein
MSTDIHMWFERRENGVFRPFRITTECDFLDPKCSGCHGTGRQSRWWEWHRKVFQYLGRWSWDEERPALLPTRGVPDDFDLEQMQEFEKEGGSVFVHEFGGGDLHTISWATLRELQAIRDRLVGTELGDVVIPAMEAAGPPDDVRIIWGFDN